LALIPGGYIKCFHPENPKNMTETPETRPDRLSSLMARFTLSVSPAPVGTGNLIVLATQDGTADHALLCLRGKALHSGERAPLLSARVDWGGVANPLASALPDPVRVDLRQDAMEFRQVLLCSPKNLVRIQRLWPVCFLPATFCFILSAPHASGWRIFQTALKLRPPSVFIRVGSLHVCLTQAPRFSTLFAGCKVRLVMRWIDMISGLQPANCREEFLDCLFRGSELQTHH
jgi:hypothetical protein